MVDAWNRTEAPYPAGLCIHRLVEAQVERTPHAVAVVAGGETLTYREPNARAGRLAGRLAFGIAVPHCDPFVTPLLYAIPIQLLAYHTAVIKGTDVDQPRNLAKSVTVE